MKTTSPVLGLLLITLIIGCGPSNELMRYELSGEVTFKGQPVPQGHVRLMPDGTAGNTGPGSVAEIVDGKYRTNEGSGVVGGPYRLQILGYETITSTGKDAMFPDVPLFPLYTDEIQLEAADAVMNFDIPEQ